MATTTETPSDEPNPSAEEKQRQMRQMLLFGVLGFVVLVFLLLVAFGGSKPPVTKPPDMPPLTNIGLQIAEQKVEEAGWQNVFAYDATGQDRSMRDERDWRVCFQTPVAAKSVKDKSDDPPMVIDGQDSRDLKEVWLGAVRTDEDCATLAGNDYGMVPRVYDLNGSKAGKGTNLIPNLVSSLPRIGYTAHMARLAFGEDASIRVRPVSTDRTDQNTNGLISEFTGKLKKELTGKDVLKADDAADVGGGWDNWRICKQSPEFTLTVAGNPATVWNGLVVDLDVVPYGEVCPPASSS